MRADKDKFVKATWVGVGCCIVGLFISKFHFAGAWAGFWFGTGLIYGYPVVRDFFSRIMSGCFAHILFWIWLFAFSVALGNLFGWILYLIDGGRLLVSLFNSKSSYKNVYTEDEDSSYLNNSAQDNKTESRDSLQDALNRINSYKDKVEEED